MSPNVPEPAPPKPKPSPDRLDGPNSGLFSFVFACVCAALGFSMGNTALQLLGYALALFAVANVVLAVRQIRRLAGTRRIVGTPVAGCPFTVEVTLTCLDGHRRGMDLTNGATETELFWAVADLASQEPFRGSALLTLKRRGRCGIGELRAGSTHPFGLVRFSRAVVPADEVLVLPALGRLRQNRFRRLLGGPEDARPRRNAHSPFAQDEVRGLRDFRPGDALRCVHWRTTARVGRPMVREFDDPPGDGLLIVLDPTPKDKTREGRAVFEAAVSLAATLCWESRECRWLGLLLATAAPVVSGKAPDRAHAQSLLEALALVEPGPRASEHDLRAALGELPRAAVLLVASGPSPLEAVLRQGLRRTVVCLDPADPAVRDFYDPPGLHAAQWGDA